MDRPAGSHSGSAHIHDLYVAEDHSAASPKVGAWTPGDKAIVIELPVRLVGDGMLVPCLDGRERPYVSFDAAASTGALEAVLERVQEFLPAYSSVHRGAGYKSQLSTRRYEQARESALRFAGREGRDDVAIICRNTTEAINHLAYRLRLTREDTVVTSVVEHHANLLPWSRVRDLPLRRVRARRDLHRASRRGRAGTGTKAPPARAHRGLEHNRLDAAD